MFLIILKSMLLGFLITLPTGPIGILCLRKILQLGPLRGFIFGLSQTLALFIFSVLAAFSLREISELLISYQFWLRLIDGLVLCKLSFRINFGVKAAEIAERKFIRIVLIRMNLRSYAVDDLSELSRSKLSQKLSLQSTSSP